MRHIALLVIALMLGATKCYAASVDGYWYGIEHHPELRRTLEWLAILRPDGALSVEFRTYEDCQPKIRRTETGWWTVSGRIISNKILAVDGRAAPNTAFNYRTYVILELDDRKMRFVHRSSGEERTVERVPPDFTFPKCKGVI